MKAIYKFFYYEIKRALVSTNYLFIQSMHVFKIRLGDFKCVDYKKKKKKCNCRLLLSP